MSKFKDASENIKRLQVMFSGLIELGDLMDKVDNLDGYVIELEGKKVSLLKDCELLKVDKQMLDVEYKSTKDKLANLVADSHKEASDIVANASVKAEKLVKDADSKVKEIDVLVEEKLKKYQDKIQAMNLELKASEEKVKASEAKLKEVNLALEKIKGGI